jgi:hypothetical protein
VSDVPTEPEEVDEDHPHPPPNRGEQEPEYIETHEKAAKESRSD